MIDLFTFIKITIWARKQYVDAGFASDPLDMYVKIFDQFLDIFRSIPESFPPKIGKELYNKK